MHISKITLILLAIGAPAFAPTGAIAQTTFTFNVTDGNWATPGNWDPPTGGSPGSADTAIIPSGKTCRVKTANQAAANVEVQSGGTLVVESKSLTVAAGGARVTVDGTLQLNNTGAGTAQLLWLNGSVIFAGSGVIDAGDGAILNAGTAGPTIKGTVIITPDGDLFNYGTLLVDDSNDTMTLGKLISTGTLRVLHGTGELKVTAGTIQLGRMAFAGSEPGWSGTTTVNGANAKLKLTDHVSDIRLSGGCVFLRGGGTIDFDRTMLIMGGFDFGLGTVNVAAGETVIFSGDCP